MLDGLVHYMETMIIDLHELIEEATRILRFLANKKISAYCFNNNVTFHDSLIVKYEVTETPYDFSSAKDIDYQKRIAELELFPIPFSRNIVTVRGSLLLLTRRNGFVEIEVTGERYIPTVSHKDIVIEYKNPVERDLSFLIDKYQDIYQSLLVALKASISYVVVKNEKTRYNLHGIIEHIKKIDEKTNGMKEKTDVPVSSIDEFDVEMKRKKRLEELSRGGITTSNIGI